MLGFLCLTLWGKTYNKAFVGATPWAALTQSWSAFSRAAPFRDSKKIGKNKSVYTEELQKWRSYQNDIYLKVDIFLDPLKTSWICQCLCYYRTRSLRAQRTTRGLLRPSSAKGALPHLCTGFHFFLENHGYATASQQLWHRVSGWSISAVT